jgi:hypothetical protein
MVLPIPPEGHADVWMARMRGLSGDQRAGQAKVNWKRSGTDAKAMPTSATRGTTTCSASA